MSARFGVVAVLNASHHLGEQELVSREFESWDEIPALMAELEAVHPAWRALTFCKVEDLPLLLSDSTRKDRT